MILSQWYGDGRWFGPMSVESVEDDQTRRRLYKAKVALIESKFFGALSPVPREEAMKSHRIVFSTPAFEDSKTALDVAYQEALKRISDRAA